MTNLRFLFFSQLFLTSWFQAATESEPLYVVEVLLHCSKDSVKDAATEAARPAAAGETGEMQVGGETERDEIRPLSRPDSSGPYVERVAAAARVPSPEPAGEARCVSVSRRWSR